MRRCPVLKHRPTWRPLAPCCPSTEQHSPVEGPHSQSSKSGSCENGCCEVASVWHHSRSDGLGHEVHADEISRETIRMVWEARYKLASFAAVFRLVPSHKRLLNQAIHSFPIVLPIRQFNKLRSRKESWIFKFPSKSVWRCSLAPTLKHTIL